jgi:hypothetical protein
MRYACLMKYACLLSIALTVLGCGKADYYSGDPAAVSYEEDTAREASHQIDPSGTVTDSGAGEVLSNSDALQRKIIYTADVKLVVEEFNSIPSKVEKLVEDFEGYVAGSAVTGSPGIPRSGQWTIRVPVRRYGKFITAVQKLGEVRRVSSDSKDVSEEYYDLEARIRNKKKQEARLLELLADATGKLEEVLSVERELARVREEIERMEGRVRVLNDLTSLTTIELTINEIKGYVPEEAPTYSTRVRRAFEGSIASLVSVADGLSIALIVALPWLGVLLVPAIVLILFVRRCRRR